MWTSFSIDGIMKHDMSQITIFGILAIKQVLPELTCTGIFKSISAESTNGNRDFDILLQQRI